MKVGKRSPAYRAEPKTVIPGRDIDEIVHKRRDEGHLLRAAWLSADALFGGSNPIISLPTVNPSRPGMLEL